MPIDPRGLLPCPAPGGAAPDVLVWRRVFAGTLDQVPEARRFARLLLDGTPAAGDAGLVVGELAGNAVRHTRSGEPGGSFTVEIVMGAGKKASVLITVYDLGGRGVPRFGGEGPDAYDEGGRGLAIVAAVARRAGCQGVPAGGHRVWAYLADAPDPGPASWE